MIRTAVLAGLLLFVSSTAAQAASTTSISIAGSAAKSLRSQGVSVIAIPPASATATRWRLPIASGATARITRHQGGVQLRARRGGKTRRLAITGFQLRAAPGAALTAVIGGRRVTLVRLPSAGIGAATLGTSAAAAIRRRLHLRTTPRGRLGTLRVAREPSGDGTAAPPTPGSGTPAGPATPGGPSRECAAAGTPAAGEPALPARPATALGITAAAIKWHVRDSFTNYIATGEGSAALDGATAAAPSGTPPLAREFSFPLRDGWWDPLSGSASVRFSGCVRFSFAGHGIRIEAQDPEIELAASGSRAVMRFSGSTTTAARAVLADLAFTAPIVSPDGHTRTWSQLAATIPAGTATSVFAGFYLPGDPFGWFTVSVTS